MARTHIARSGWKRARRTITPSPESDTTFGVRRRLGTLAWVSEEEPTGEARTTASTIHVGVRIGPVGIRVKTIFWIWWAEVAIEQERLAHEARAAYVAAHDSAEGSRYLSHEGRAALVTLTACAAALDAMFGAVAKLVPAVRTDNRGTTILETFKGAFKTGPQNRRWSDEIAWLFDQRGSAAHFSETESTPQPHPTGLTNVSQENIDYSAESAKRAVDLLLDVLDVCTSSPKPSTTSWAKDFRPSAERLIESRT